LYVLHEIIVIFRNTEPIPYLHQPIPDLYLSVPPGMLNKYTTQMITVNRHSILLNDATYLPLRLLNEPIAFQIVTRAFASNWNRSNDIIHCFRYPHTEGMYVIRG